MLYGRLLGCIVTSMDTTEKNEQEVLTGEDAGQVLGFIDDPLLAGKRARQAEFAREVKLGLAKASDASMFRFGLKFTVKYRSDEF